MSIFEYKIRIFNLAFCLKYWTLPKPFRNIEYIFKRILGISHNIFCPFNPDRYFEMLMRKFDI